MGRVSMATRDELVAALVELYAVGSRAERGLILDEFVAVTKFHRKHATRLLKGRSRGRRVGPRPGRRVYDDAAREALIVLWEASDRICGKRLRPLVPVMLEAMERHGHLQLATEVRIGLLGMSAATMDRALREAKRFPGRKRRRAPPSAAVRRSVPVRTFSDWGDPAPGFIEADPVAHGGPTAAGSFADAPEVAFAIEQPTLEQFLSSLRITWREGKFDRRLGGRRQRRGTRATPQCCAAIRTRMRVNQDKNGRLCFPVGRA
jgi:hypothetical protein